MAKKFYSEEDKREFIECAQEMGVSPAMRKLNYPGSWSTAQRWFVEADLELPTVDSLASKAAQMKAYYGDHEKLYGAQVIADRIIEMAHETELTPDEINKLTNAYSKAIQTFNLIEGKATNISESHTKDGADLALMDMLNEQKARNVAFEQGISAD